MYVIRNRHKIVLAFLIFVATQVLYSTINYLAQEINFCKASLDNYFSNYRFNDLPPLSSEMACNVNISIYPRISVTKQMTNKNSDPLQNTVVFLKGVQKEFKLRNAIRKTWGKYFKKRLVFTLSGEITAEIKQEADKYGDILLLQYQDHYQKLVIKTIQTYKLMAQLKDIHPHIRWFFSGDSDAFIIPNNLRKFLLNHFNEENSIYGLVISRRLTKWVYGWLPVSYQSPRTYYPDFVAGVMTLMTHDVPQKLNNAVPHIKPLNIEDIYTGMLAEHAHVNIRRTSTKYFCLFTLKLVQVGMHEIFCDYSEVVATGEFKSPLQVTRLWKHLPELMKI